MKQIYIYIYFIFHNFKNWFLHAIFLYAILYKIFQNI